MTAGRQTHPRGSETVRDGVTGLLGPVGDPESLGNAIIRMLNEPELRARLVSQAATMVTAEFTWNAMVSGNIHEYGQLLKTAAAH